MKQKMIGGTRPLRVGSASWIGEPNATAVPYEPSLEIAVTSTQEDFLRFSKRSAKVLANVALGSSWDLIYLAHRDYLTMRLGRVKFPGVERYLSTERDIEGVSTLFVDPTHIRPYLLRAAIDDGFMANVNGLEAPHRELLNTYADYRIGLVAEEALASTGITPIQRAS